MRQTVLANPGAIGISFAGVTDKFQIIANSLMIADRLLGQNTDEKDVVRALEIFGISPVCENIEKVKSFFSSSHDWSN